MLLLIALFAAIFAYFYANRRFYSLAAKIPGNNGLPLIGELHKFAGLDLQNYARQVLSYSDPHAAILKVWLWPMLVLITEDADSIHALLNSPHAQDKPAFFYGALFMDEALLACNGRQYDRHRRILNRAFTPRMLQLFLPEFARKSRICIEKMRQHIDGAAFNVFESVGTCLIDVFASGHLNYERDFYGSRLVATIEEIRPLVMRRLFSPWLGLAPLYKISPLRRQMERYERLLMRHIDEIKAVNGEAPKTADSVINLLLDEANGFSEREVRDELVNFIFGGYETTAISLASVLLMVAMHGDVQRKIVDEVSAVTREPLTEALPRLRYTEMVIKESLRLFGPGGLLARQTTAEIDIGGCTIPRGACIVLNMHGMHRNERHWGADAHLFRPERFEPGSFGKVHPHAFAPFSGGKRVCIGVKYSMNFMKVFLLEFFKAYSIATDLKYDDIEIAMTPTLVVAQKYMIKVRDRKKLAEASD